jgi:hypothetical protein
MPKQPQPPPAHEQHPAAGSERKNQEPHGQPYQEHRIAGDSQQPREDSRAKGVNGTGKHQDRPSNAPPRISVARALFATLARFLKRAAGAGFSKWVALATAIIAAASVYVTTLYFLATVGILLAMATSNNLAKAAQKEGKDAADADREQMRQQLAAMESSSTATNALAIAAKDTAKATADLVEVTQRAWIAVETRLDDGLMSGIAFYGENDLRVSIQCNIKNIGHSVANNVQLRSKLMFLMANESNLDRVSQLQSELADQPPSGRLGITLFPEEPGVLTDWLFAGKADFENALHDPDEGSTTPRIAPIVVGCVVYEYPNSTIHHATRFAYSIYRNRARHIPPPPPYRPGIDVGVSLRHPDEIAFVKYFGGGGAN